MHCCTLDRAQEERRLAEERAAKAEALGGDAEMSDAISMDGNGGLSDGGAAIDLTAVKLPCKLNGSYSPLVLVVDSVYGQPK